MSNELLIKSADFAEWWGGWRLDGELCLWYPAYPGGGAYPVDIERFTTSAVVLDLIMQVAKKDWADDKCLAGLVRALNDILQPQANLCSCGVSKELSPAKIRRLVGR
jgi:hypothetical protein